jgi:hypothetical protein
MQANGVVSKILDNNWGNKVLYTIMLDGDPTYYGCGEDNPRAHGAQEGGTVSFEWKENAKGKAVVTKGSVVASNDAPAQAEAAPVPSASNAAPAADYRQKSIIFQSSRKDAIELVSLALNLGAVALPKTVAKQFEFIESLVDAKTNQFFDDAVSLEAGNVSDGE